MTLLSRPALVLFGIALALFVWETGHRLDQYARKGISIWENPSSRFDKRLGWLGKEYRLPSARSTNGPPVLVLGDSFTEGMGIPAEKMWFASLRTALPQSEIIAYGGRGYGTLQELLVLENYLANGISPRTLVLQLCSNDIINNDFNLDRQSASQRAPGPRPYLEGSEIHMRLPRAWGGLLYPLISFSRVAYGYETRWEQTVAERAGRGEIASVESEIQKRGWAFQEFRQGSAVTDQLIKKMKTTAGKTEFLALLVDDNEPNTTALRDILRRQNIPLVIAPRVVQLDESTRLSDKVHFNEAGNILVGESFVREMQSKGRLQP